MYNVCRLCLRKKAIFNIFDNDTAVYDKLLSYCKLNIAKNDGLPEQICNKCIKKLECVVDFINRCEESDRLLRKSTNTLDNVDQTIVKDEPDSDSNDKSYKFDDTNSEEEYIPDFTRNIINLSSTDKIKKEDAKENILNENNKSFNTIDDDKIPLANLVKQNKNKKIKAKKNKVICDAKDSIINHGTDLEIKSESGLNLDITTETFGDDQCSENESASKESTKIKDKARKMRISKFGDESQLCFTCGKCFPRASYLRQHILKHSGERHKCSQCPKSFSTRELMKVHERRHVQEKNFPCQVCGHTFTSGYLAKKHYKMVHEKNYAVSCNLCSKVLSNRRSLMEHMKIHTGEKNFECKICGKKFAHKLSLVCHTRVHTGEQPYSCRYCEKRFTILKSLKEHERLHTGEKPYSCPLCPKRFEQLGNMKSHFRYNHKGLDLKEVQQAKAKAQEALLT